MVFAVNELIGAMVDSIMISNVVFAKSEAVIIMPKSIFKNPYGQTGLSGRSSAKPGFMRPTSLNFSQFVSKSRIDNKAPIRYPNPVFFHTNENCRWV
jgi:hypothetical protein